MKDWQRITAEKGGPCRVCPALGFNGFVHPNIHLHHVVTRSDGGDDLAANIVPVCGTHHTRLHNRDRATGQALLERLTDAEYAYMIQRGGEDYPERAYGLAYSR